MQDQQVVVVTGASGGNGRAVARAYGRRGARVGLLARGERGLEATAEDVRAAGGQALAVPTDVADHKRVTAAADKVESELGEIDIWVNVAFASVFASFTRILPDEFRRVTEVTYLGYVYGTMAALQGMRARDRGVIVQVGSALAYRGIPLQTAYCGAKHAIQGFNEALRCELLHDGSRVKVTMAQLPAVNTPHFSWVLSRLPRHAQPVPPIYQPEVAARAIAPGLVDRYLARTGFSSQQTESPRDPRQPVNLWKPADSAQGRDYGAHGEFDDRAPRAQPPAVGLAAPRLRGGRYRRAGRGSRGSAASTPVAAKPVDATARCWCGAQWPETSRPWAAASAPARRRAAW